MDNLDLLRRVDFQSS